jgi:hypothetical protein
MQVQLATEGVNNLLLKTGSKNVTGLVIYAVKNDIVKVF